MHTCVVCVCEECTECTNGIRSLDKWLKDRMKQNNRILCEVASNWHSGTLDRSDLVTLSAY